MNREVHVRFWESAGLQCPAPLAYLWAYANIPEARASISRYIDVFYNARRPHSSLDRRTPDETYFTALQAIPVAA
jgi:putative transposase